MSWSDDLITIRKGKLARLVILGSSIIGSFALAVGVILAALLDKLSPALVIALVTLFGLRALISLLETTAFYVRRSRRRHRMRRNRNCVTT